MLLQAKQLDGRQNDPKARWHERGTVIELHQQLLKEVPLPQSQRQRSTRIQVQTNGNYISALPKAVKKKEREDEIGAKVNRHEKAKKDGIAPAAAPPQVSRRIMLDIMGSDL